MTSAHFVLRPTDCRPTSTKNVVVDLLDCEYMDSGALGCLVGLHRRLEKHGGALRIQNANADLRLLFELTELDKLFAMVSDRKLLAKCPLIIPHFDAINDELVEYFARHPERLDTDLDWRGFELLLEAVFRNQGFRTQIGSGRADGGVDIRLLTSDAFGDPVTLVQELASRRLQ